MATALLRSIGSDHVRELARRALDQGWDLYPNGGGHLAVVNPTTGARVTLATRSTSGGHGTANVRAALARAGLDLRSRSEVRRAQRQESRMQVHDVPAPLAIVPIPEDQDHRRGRPPLHLEDREALSIGGRRVVITRKADGRWAGSTKDARFRSGRRSWAGQDRDTMVARIAQDLAAEAAPAAEPEGDVELVLAGLDVAAAGGTPTPAQDAARDRLVGGEYPMAAALDHLDAALAPGLAALEAAGRTDAAELVRAELVRTPLEDELLRLYRRVMTGA